MDNLLLLYLASLTYRKILGCISDFEYRIFSSIREFGMPMNWDVPLKCQLLCFPVVLDNTENFSEPANVQIIPYLYNKTVALFLLYCF